MSARVLRPLLFSLAFGVLVMLGLSIYGDLPSVFAAFQAFDWRLAPAALALTLVNYGLRYVKWRYYLGLIGAGHTSERVSALTFLSGLSMVLTPAKIGEWLKSYLLRDLAGVPVSRSAPVVLAERLTDGIAMVLLAVAGLIVYDVGREIVAGISLVLIAILVVSQHKRMSGAIIRVLTLLPWLRRKVNELETLRESSRLLFSIRSLAVAIGLGVISWGAECVAFFLILVGLGLTPSPSLLLQATFILAVANLVGAVSMLPGGLAAAEGSIAGLLVLLKVTQTATVAAAATLLIRLATLWFGVAVGAVALVLVGRLTRLSTIPAGPGEATAS